MASLLTGSAGQPDRRVLFVSLVFGAVAAGLVVAFLAAERGTTPVSSSASDVAILVASRDIPVGTTIDERMLDVRVVPGSALASDTFREADRAAVVGQTTRYPIASGEQLGATKLVASPDVRALSFQIPSGMRAFTIPVSESESPAGLLAPGDFVDVLVVGSASALLSTAPVPLTAPPAGATPTAQRAEPQVVITLLQNVQVISVQKTFVANGVPYDPSVRGEPPDGGVSHVTLSLTPDQTQLMWLARQAGKVTLSLRRFGEDTTQEIEPLAGPLVR